MSLFIEIIDTYGIKHIDDYHDRCVDFVIVPFNERSLLEILTKVGTGASIGKKKYQ